MSDDPYQILGVGKDATDAEIKRTYRKLARQHHPDRNPDDAAAEERFKAIQAAHEQIGSAEARKKYDEEKRMQDMFSGGRPFGGAFGGNPFGGGGFGGGGGIDLSDIFSQFMGSRGGAPSGSAGFGFDQNVTGGRQNQRGRRGQTVGQQAGHEAGPPPRGADIESGLDIGLIDALNGTEVKFSHRRLRKCSKCKGESFGSAKGCTTCNGIGINSKTSTITVKVPAGATHGQQMRLKKMGNEHPSGEPGDLLIKIRLDAEEGRRWEDGRLVQEVQIPFTMMQLGGKVRIMTPTGKRVQIEVPEGTRIGDRRRLQGHGHDGGPLDIEFVLSEPEKLTKAQRAVLEKLRESGL